MSFNSKCFILFRTGENMDNLLLSSKRLLNVLQEKCWHLLFVNTNICSIWLFKTVNVLILYSNLFYQFICYDTQIANHFATNYFLNIKGQPHFQRCVKMILTWKEETEREETKKERTADDAINCVTSLPRATMLDYFSRSFQRELCVLPAYNPFRRAFFSKRGRQGVGEHEFVLDALVRNRT